MDFLLSLPVFSYVATPMLNSWSASLNFLFFYITWATLVFTHSPLKIELVGTLAVRIVFWLVPSILFLLFDALLPGLVQSIKLFGSVSTAPRSVPAQAKQTLLAIVNLALLTALQAAISTAVTSLLRRPPFKTSIALPLPWPLIKHIFALYAAREVLTYYIHRYILHSCGIITRLHAQYAHERKGAAPYSLLLYADHPLPLVFSHLVPVYLPSLVIRPHLLTYFLFTLLTTIEEMLSMSGYNVVPGIVMSSIAMRTATHYASGGRGNYGVWGLLDCIHGTSVGKDTISYTRGKIKKPKVRVKREPVRRVINTLREYVQDGTRSQKGTRKGRKTGYGKEQ
ncbi:sterol desaturase family [Xylaria intraflava]|nr:sterol desaturase family [Xylaria intraflava]